MGSAGFPSTSPSPPIPSNHPRACRCKFETWMIDRSPKRWATSGSKFLSLVLYVGKSSSKWDHLEPPMLLSRWEISKRCCLTKNKQHLEIHMAFLPIHGGGKSKSIFKKKHPFGYSPPTLKRPRSLCIKQFST